MCFALPFVLGCFGFMVSFVLVAVVGRFPFASLFWVFLCNLCFVSINKN